MAHRVIDRCKETTSTTGTGTLTLTGAVSKYVAVADAVAGLTANGDTSWFCAENGTEWEIFLGTRVDATHLARTTVISSSNAGAAVSFTLPPVVFSTVPGAKFSAVGGPAFSAYLSADQTGITASTWTKAALNTEAFDTAGCFDSVTNRRFTPNIAGYYKFDWLVRAMGATLTGAYAALYKNGVLEANGSTITINSLDQRTSGSYLTYMNGTTDYVELFVFLVGTTLKLYAGGAGETHLAGYLARPA